MVLLLQPRSRTLAGIWQMLNLPNQRRTDKDFPPEQSFLVIDRRQRETVIKKT